MCLCMYRGLNLLFFGSMAHIKTNGQTYKQTEVQRDKKQVYKLTIQRKKYSNTVVNHSV